MEQQVYARMVAVEDEHWWFVARRRILEEALRRFVPLPAEARLLEAGCGTGGNLAMLAGFGEVSAFEPNAWARRLAHRKTGLQVREGRLPGAIPFADDAFDLVAALDVLEHLDEDLASLTALRSRLRPGGWMLITVPAYAFLWGRHDETLHHKRRYNKDSLISLVTRAGLTPVKVTYFNTLLLPLIVVVRLVKKALKIDHPEDVVPPGVVNRALCALFASERHLIGRFALPAGVSLLMVARRPAD